MTEFAIETCDNLHRYAFIVGEPKPRCPFCLAVGLDKARELETKIEGAVWIATRDFKGILNELQRRAIALATVEALQSPASTTKAEGR